MMRPQVSYNAAFCTTAALLVSFVTASQPDCVFNTRQISLFQSIHYNIRDAVPCSAAGYKEHIRDVSCLDGSTIHVCCNMPYREDIQRSRQVWFRFIIAMCTAISRRCTGRVLCEQACKDGLSGVSVFARSSYPQVLAGDGRLTREFVEAYAHGEAVSRCQQRNVGNRGRVDDSACEKVCKYKHPECHKDEIRLNYMSRLFYASARIFHVVGMSTFHTEWMVREGLKDTRTRFREVGPALKKAFGLLLTRMTGLNGEYEDWRRVSNANNIHDDDGHHDGRIGRRRRRAPLSGSSDHTAAAGISWKQFLHTYNGTDPELVGVAFGTTLTYSEYQEWRNLLNEVVEERYRRRTGERWTQYK